MCQGLLSQTYKSKFGTMNNVHLLPETYEKQGSQEEIIRGNGIFDRYSDKLHNPFTVAFHSKYMDDAIHG